MPESSAASSCRFFIIINDRRSSRTYLLHQAVAASIVRRRRDFFEEIFFINRNDTPVERFALPITCRPLFAGRAEIRPEVTLMRPNRATYFYCHFHSTAALLLSPPFCCTPRTRSVNVGFSSALNQLWLVRRLSGATMTRFGCGKSVDHLKLVYFGAL